MYQALRGNVLGRFYQKGSGTAAVSDGHGFRREEEKFHYVFVIEGRDLNQNLKKSQGVSQDRSGSNTGVGEKIGKVILDTT